MTKTAKQTQLDIEKRREQLRLAQKKHYETHKAGRKKIQFYGTDILSEALQEIKKNEDLDNLTDVILDLVGRYEIATGKKVLHYSEKRSKP